LNATKVTVGIGGATRDRMRVGRVLVAVLLLGCTGTPQDAVPAQSPELLASTAAVVPSPTSPPAEEWLKGSTHVHSKYSGDSNEPVAGVVRWYREHDYDFIVLTDHNHVTAVEGETGGLIVIPGVELTYNPSSCRPRPPERGGKCRLHANLLGPSARPRGRIEWANRRTRERFAQYQRAIDLSREWGGLVQINHPQAHWGMTGELLTELGHRGAPLVEIWNQQYRRWEDGDEYPSTEALWDEALRAGVTLWGVASDDAHHYRNLRHARYPAGGAWVMVRASRDPDAILDALAAGRFYASTGVELTRAGSDGSALVVEIAPTSLGDHLITFIGDGRVLAEHRGRAARHSLSGASYVRAVVERRDGARAWVQPARALR
jgi:hypothetical protein